MSTNFCTSWSRGLRAIACVLPLLCAPAAHALEPGEPAPQFRAPSLDGKTTVALAAYRGKVVYVDFWASWCPPCLTSLPLLDDLSDEFAETDFQVVGVNVDQETLKARAFLDKHPVGYPSASDPKGTVPERFEIETMPTSFLVDREGVIRYVHRGFRAGDIAELRERIAKLVASGS